MTGGWLKLHRKLLEKPIWQESTPEQKVVLITLLSMANHEEKEWEWQGKPYKAKPGQFVTSLESIRKKCGSGISIQNIRTSIKRFEKYEFLTNESTKQNRLITVLNWELYQSKEEDLTKKLTVNQQTTNRQLTTNKNDKELKNEKNNKKNNVGKPKKRVYADDDPNKILARTLLKVIKKNHDIKEPDLDKWANTIRLMIENDNRPGKDVQDLIVWSSEDRFWYKQILSADSLRKHYDKMMAQKNDRFNKNSGGERLKSEEDYDYSVLPF